VVEAGAQAVFAFPLRIGAIRIGVLDLYRDRPGLLTDDQHADSLVLANVAAEMILLLQADAPAGTVAAELDAGSDFHPIVHQTSGMVAAQLGVSVRRALLRLRARAFATGRSVHSVARDVVSGRLRFDDAIDDPRRSDDHAETTAMTAPCRATRSYRTPHRPRTDWRSDGQRGLARRVVRVVRRARRHTRR
jgi:hypothetical protein